jgi:hypothetical protein
MFSLYRIRKGEQISQDLLAGFQSAPQDAEQPSTTEPVLESTGNDISIEGKKNVKDAKEVGASQAVSD